MATKRAAKPLPASRARSPNSLACVSSNVRERGGLALLVCEEQRAESARMLEDNREIALGNRQAQRDLELEKRKSKYSSIFDPSGAWQGWRGQIEAVHDAAFNLIEVELTMCELSADLAFHAGGLHAKAKLIGNARRAHDATVRLLPLLALSTAQLEMFDQRLTALRAKLEDLGDIALDTFGPPQRTGGAAKTPATASRPQLTCVDLFMRPKSAGGDAVWIESALGIDAAIARMNAVAAERRGEYFVFDLRSHTVLAQIDTTERNG